MIGASVGLIQRLRARRMVMDKNFAVGTAHVPKAGYFDKFRANSRAPRRCAVLRIQEKIDGKEKESGGEAGDVRDVEGRLSWSEKEAEDDKGRFI